VTVGGNLVGQTRLVNQSPQKVLFNQRILSTPSHAPGGFPVAAFMIWMLFSTFRALGSGVKTGRVRFWNSVEAVEMSAGLFNGRPRTECDVSKRLLGQREGGTTNLIHGNTISPRTCMLSSGARFIGEVEKLGLGDRRQIGPGAPPVVGLVCRCLS